MIIGLSCLFAGSVRFAMQKLADERAQGKVLRLCELLEFTLLVGGYDDGRNAVLAFFAFHDCVKITEAYVSCQEVISIIFAIRWKTEEGLGLCL